MPTPKSKDVGDQIVALKEQGKTWGEISEHVSLPQGKAMFLYEQKTVTPKSRITAKTEDELKQKIAQARTEGQSWGKISARSGKSEGYCKKAFEEVTGNEALGNRIGKGGRYPGSGPQMATGATKKAAGKSRGVVKSSKKTGPAKKAVAKKGTAAKKAPAKKTAKKTAASAA